MSDIFSVIRRLDLRKSRKITAEEANIATPPLAKYQTLKGHVRKIEKIPVKFYLAELIYVGNPITLFGYQPRLLFTYQVSLPSDFYFLKNDNFLNGFTVNSALYGFVCARFRVGTTAYRYLLQGEIGNTWINPTTGIRTYIPELAITPYSNQKIGKNCTIEFWLRGHTPLGPFVGYSPPVKWTSSLLVNPIDGDQTEVLIQATPPIEIPAMSFTLPAAFPVDLPNTQFLDNPDYTP